MTTYYLDPDGTDSASGTESDPWASPGAAAGNVSPGDTVVVRDGTYVLSGAQRIDSPDASSDNPITIRAADGASPVFDWGWEAGDGGGHDYSDQGSVRVSADGWVFEGLTFTGSPYMGLRINTGSTDVTVRECVARNNYLTGYYAREAVNPTFEDTLAHHNDGSGGNSDGLALSGCSGGTILRSVSHNNSDDGFDLWASTDVTIDRCKAYANGGGGDGNGFKMGNDESSGNTVQRSVAWNNSHYGFTWNRSPSDFLNNTSYNNYGGFTVNGSNTRLCNNIAFGNENNYFGSDPTYRANSWGLDIGDPNFKSTDSSTEDYLHLQESSPAIDAGTDVGLEYSGSAPDLGYVQFEATSSTGRPVSYHDGSGYREVAVKYHDGNDWRQTTAKVHDGSGFV